MRAIGFFLNFITFGKMTSFMRSFTTTIGATVYTPALWDSWMLESQAAVLRHERIHMRQSRKYTPVLFKFLYLFAFLPFGLAYFRAKFEMEAYEESLRTYHSYGSDITSAALKASVVGHFTSAEYCWMWPFRKSVEDWYDKTVQSIVSTK
jgi:hypothetical protein